MGVRSTLTVSREVAEDRLKQLMNCYLTTAQLSILLEAFTESYNFIVTETKGEADDNLLYHIGGRL